MTIDTQQLRELAQAIIGWENCRDAWPHEEHDGIAVVGNIDDDGNKYPVVEIDAGQYFADADASRLAAFYAAANPSAVLALLDEVDNNRKAMNAAQNVIKSQELTISHMRSKADRNNEAVTTLDSERAANAAMTDERDAMIETMHHMRAELEKLRTVEAAARNLVKVKGRRHAEIAYQKLVEVLG